MSADAAFYNNIDTCKIFFSDRKKKISNDKDNLGCALFYSE